MVFDLEESGQTLGTEHDKGLHFILSMNRPTLLKSLITKVNNDPYYFRTRSLRDFVREIKSHHSVEHVINPSLNYSGLETSKPAKETESKETKNPGKPSRDTNNKQQDTPFVSNVNKAEKQRFKLGLTSSRDKVAYLVSILQQYSSSCPLHLEGNHVICDCRVLESICKEASASGFLQKAK